VTKATLERRAKKVMPVQGAILAPPAQRALKATPELQAQPVQLDLPAHKVRYRPSHLPFQPSLHHPRNRRSEVWWAMPLARTSDQLLMKVEGGGPVCSRQDILYQAVRQRTRHLEEVASGMEFEVEELSCRNHSRFRYSKRLELLSKMSGTGDVRSKLKLMLR
jgi:hypothetical protein